MDNTREKLVDLLGNTGYFINREVVGYVADKLIANGVTVQKVGYWIEENGVQICSNCGEEHAWDEYRASYCEDCGAKMLP